MNIRETTARKRGDQAQRQCTEVETVQEAVTVYKERYSREREV
jgi:hypothetical protein